ncbi:MAG TPA: hypothetical protein VF606_07180, partial [Geminicoccaceae bacterium]
RRGCDAALAGLLVATSALARTESRGAHWRADHPGQAPARHTETTLADAWRVAEAVGAHARSLRAGSVQA